MEDSGESEIFAKLEEYGIKTTRQQIDVTINLWGTEIHTGNFYMSMILLKHVYFVMNNISFEDLKKINLHPGAAS